MLTATLAAWQTRVLAVTWTGTRAGTRKMEGVDDTYSLLTATVAAWQTRVLVMTWTGSRVPMRTMTMLETRRKKAGKN